MKRKQETKIMMKILKNHGFPETAELANAVTEGLKAVRVEKFKERQFQKGNEHGLPQI